MDGALPYLLEIADQLQSCEARDTPLSADKAGLLGLRIKEAVWALMPQLRALDEIVADAAEDARMAAGAGVAIGVGVGGRRWRPRIVNGGKQ